MQSIQESLSTFSSHMINIINIISKATENSLILVDELGSGTDPEEGSALAISILSYLNKINALTIATTHYTQIKNYALITNGFENAACEFDIENLTPTYRLLIGVPGKSNAFEISKRLGLSDVILKEAKSFLTDDSVKIEDLLKSIYDDKNEIEKEKEIINKNLNQIETLRKSLENQVLNNEKVEKELIQKAKLEARNILLNAKEEANEIIKEMNNLKQSQTESTLTNANNLRIRLNSLISNSSPISDKNETSSLNSLSENDIKIGMTVLFKPLNSVATVLCLPNKSKDLQIQIGNAKMTANIKNLEKTNQSASSTATTIYKTKKDFNLKSKNISSEINVIGMNVDEAIFVIDKYLDDCSLANLSPVRIVHGKGTRKIKNWNS